MSAPTIHRADTPPQAPEKPRSAVSEAAAVMARHRWNKSTKGCLGQLLLALADEEGFFTPDPDEERAG